MRIALAQINSTLGDFSCNRDKILQFTARALEKKCDLVVFPEAALIGYHPFDLLERPEFFAEQEKALKDLTQKLPKNIGVIFGVLSQNSAKLGKPFYNSAVFLHKGAKPRYFHKQLLPTGDVFDEARFIEQGNLEDNYFKFGGKAFFLSICEDIWGWPNDKGKSYYKVNPLAKMKKKKVDLVINLSASPYYPRKHEARKGLVTLTAKAFKAPMFYCNLVGAQDEIVFDGHSFLCDKKGTELLACQSFDEDLMVFDLDNLPKPSKSQKIPIEEELRKAIVLGIQDYCRKTGFRKVHLGLSGGIDSALVLCLAVDALGPSNVKAFYLPTEFNVRESREASKKLCENVGVSFSEVPIQESFEVLKKTVDSSFKVKEFGLVHENLQARIRGTILMAYSNINNSLLLGTSNKSEMAVGYATLYGDMCSGLMPIGDLTKNQVVALSKHYNREHEVIPSFVIDRSPSAELRPNQKDQDSLPPYDQLDDSVVRIVEENLPAKGDLDQWLIQALCKSEFKRWQAAPILKVSKHSFGRGRRWPIAHRFGSAK